MVSRLSSSKNGTMSSEVNNTGLNKEYVYVRRLISVLTNDDSDKLIVEKLKGKNLSSLLYNAKIIDNSKNIAANKRILGCVIRAIEKEKHLCRRRELELSWGRKLLLTFNCLNPMKPFDEMSENSYRTKSCNVHNKKVSRKRVKHHNLPKSKLSQSKTIRKTVNDKLSAFSCRSEMKAIAQSNITVVQNVEITPDFPIDEYGSVLIMHQAKKFETVYPANWTNLKPKHLKSVHMHPTKTTAGNDRQVEKTTSSTQTFDMDLVVQKDLTYDTLSNNIKLQDLLEAATCLINTRDQREYVRSFLNNFEPPFDLTAGYPPYLKLPMKQPHDQVGKESIYGSNSQLSLNSERMSPAEPTENNETNQIESRVKNYVNNLDTDPWQETAESIISGVINESLPHERSDYSQLGACILKRLGAFPTDTLRDRKIISRQNTIIPEIVLSCTEWFESDSSEQEKISDTNGKSNDRSNHVSHKPNKEASVESIVEVKLVNNPHIDRSKNWEGQRVRNYCFAGIATGANEPNVDLFNMSEGSIVDTRMNGCEEVQEEAHEVARHSLDRKYFHSEPLKISPSLVIEHGTNSARKEKSAEHKKRVGDHHGQADKSPTLDRKHRRKDAKSPIRCMQEIPPNLPQKIFTVDSTAPNVDSQEQQNVTATVAHLSVFQPESQEVKEEEPAVTMYVSTPEVDNNPVVLETEETTPQDITVQVETFDGVGEWHSKVGDALKPTKSPTDKQIVDKCRHLSLQEKLRGKKKSKKTYEKPKKSPADIDLSRNCKVM